MSQKFEVRKKKKIWTKKYINVFTVKSDCKYISNVKDNSQRQFVHQRKDSLNKKKDYSFHKNIKKFIILIDWWP